MPPGHPQTVTDGNQRTPSVCFSPGGLTSHCLPVPQQVPVSAAHRKLLLSHLALASFTPSLTHFLTSPSCKHFPKTAAAAAAKSLQSYPILCDPRDSSPPGSPVPGILQARTLEPFPSPMHASEKSKCSRSVVSDS